MPPSFIQPQTQAASAVASAISDVSVTYFTRSSGFLLQTDADAKAIHAIQKSVLHRARRASDGESNKPPQAAAPPARIEERIVIRNKD